MNDMYSSSIVASMYEISDIQIESVGMIKIPQEHHHHSVVHRDALGRLFEQQTLDCNASYQVTVNSTICALAFDGAPVRWTPYHLCTQEKESLQLLNDARLSFTVGKAGLEDLRIPIVVAHLGLAVPFRT